MKKVFVFITLLTVLLLSACNKENAASPEQPVESIDRTEELSENEEPEKDVKSEARKQFEKLTEEEVITLIEKVQLAIDSEDPIDDILQEEFDIVRSMTVEEHLDLSGLTEDEVYNLIDVYHTNINLNIIFAHQEGIDSDTYNEEHRPTVESLAAEFKWIADNFDLGTNYHNTLVDDMVGLAHKHKMGDNNALFELKYTLLELNQHFNPEKSKEIRATSLSLSDVEKIRNNGEPLFDYGF